MPSGSATSQPYPLYNTTLTLHRLAPLYHGSDTASFLADATLEEHARRFHDILRGDVLRGVRVGLADTSSKNDEGLGRAGGLVDVKWVVLGDEDDWVAAGDGKEMDEERDQSDLQRGIYVEIAYERIKYIAVLLRRWQDEEEDVDEDGAEEDDGFTHLPLLLTRMPNSLRQTLLDYLTTTFDTRATPLKLPSSNLSTFLEDYLQDLTDTHTFSNDPSIASHHRASAEATLRSAIKDIQFSISLPAPTSPLLKTMDITVPKDDVAMFISTGQKILSRIGQQQGEGPFMAALLQYASSHLAMNLSHPDLKIAKIACGAFVLGAEGKVKIFDPGEDQSQDRARGKHTHDDEDGRDAGDDRWYSQSIATGNLMSALLRQSKTSLVS